jgi:hypothetical protein
MAVARLVDSSKAQQQQRHMKVQPAEVRKVQQQGDTCPQQQSVSNNTAALAKGHANVPGSRWYKPQTDWQILQQEQQQQQQQVQALGSRSSAHLPANGGSSSSSGTAAVSSRLLSRHWQKKPGRCKQDAKSNVPDATAYAAAAAVPQTSGTATVAKDSSMPAADSQPKSLGSKLLASEAAAGAAAAAACRELQTLPSITGAVSSADTCIGSSNCSESSANSSSRQPPGVSSRKLQQSSSSSISRRKLQNSTTSNAQRLEQQNSSSSYRGNDSTAGSRRAAKAGVAAAVPCLKLPSLKQQQLLQQQRSPAHAPDPVATAANLSISNSGCAVSVTHPAEACPVAACEKAARDAAAAAAAGSPWHSNRQQQQHSAGCLSPSSHTSRQGFGSFASLGCAALSPRLYEFAGVPSPSSAVAVPDTGTEATPAPAAAAAAAAMVMPAAPDAEPSLVGVGGLTSSVAAAAAAPALILLPASPAACAAALQEHASMANQLQLNSSEANAIEEGGRAVGKGSSAGKGSTCQQAKQQQLQADSRNRQPAGPSEHQQRQQCRRSSSTRV